MMQRLARSTRTVTLFPYTTLFRSVVASACDDSRCERTLFMTIFLVLGLFAGLYLLWLLFRLAVYALPVASGISLAFWMRDHDYGYLAAILGGFAAGVAVLVIGPFLFTVKIGRASCRERVCLDV